MRRTALGTRASNAISWLKVGSMMVVSSVAHTLGCSSIVSPPLKPRSSQRVRERANGKGPCVGATHAQVWEHADVW